MDPIITDSPQVVHLIQWGFYSMIVLLGLILANTLSDIKGVMSTLAEKVATVVARVESHEKRLDKLEDT